MRRPWPLLVSASSAIPAPHNLKARMTVDLLSPPLRRACSGTWGRPSQHSLLTGTILIERRIYPIAFRRISTANHHRRTGSITYASSILPDT